MFDPQSLFAGFVVGALVASAIWLITMGLIMSDAQREFHHERLEWRNLTDDEKSELDDVLAKHWEEPWRS